MKRLLLLFGLFFTVLASGQNGIRFGYSNTHLGDNFTAEYLLTTRIIEFEFGIKYLFFGPNYGCSSYLLKNRAYPKSFLQHFGSILGISSKFPIRSLNLRLEAFFQTNYTYAGLHHKSYSPYGIAPDGRELYTYNVIIFDEQHNLENAIGIGFDLAINNRFKFHNRFGPIVLLFWGIDDRILLGGNIHSEFGLMYSAGLTYTFRGKTMPNDSNIDP